MLGIESIVLKGCLEPTSIDTEGSCLKNETVIGLVSGFVLSLLEGSTARFSGVLHVPGKHPTIESFLLFLIYSLVYKSVFQPFPACILFRELSQL